jgi:hypothetical protein
MLRSSLVASAAVLLCATASAQQSRVAGLQSANLKQAGVYNMSTGKFHAAGQGALNAVQQNIYTNTCSQIAPQVWILTTTSCEDSIDIGRVPSGGVGANHLSNTWEVGYCTVQAAGAVDVDWEVVDTAALGANGGSTCNFAVPPAPPFSNVLIGFDSSAAGFPLPGSTNAALACWAVTFTGGTVVSACVTSGTASTDQFMYRLRNNAVGVQTGAFIIAGDPLAGAPGTMTFSNPLGTDIAGGDCGTGLDNTDDIWGNTDNTAIGGTPPASCVSQGAYPTGCFFFGGFPTAPFASMYFRMAADGTCTGGCTGSVAFYCTSKTNSKGCVPALSTSGFPTQGSCGTQVFNLTASNLIGAKNGQWYYSNTGPLGATFGGGHLCTKAPIKRLPVQTTGGAGSTCNGVMTTNFNTRICGGTDPALTAGKQVWAQAQHRDIPSPGAISLTNGVTFTICP